MSTNPMNRARLWRRIGATVLVPAMVLVAAVLMSALTRWLDQYLAGKAAAVLLRSWHSFAMATFSLPQNGQGFSSLMGAPGGRCEAGVSDAQVLDALAAMRRVGARGLERLDQRLAQQSVHHAWVDAASRQRPHSDVPQFL